MSDPLNRACQTTVLALAYNARTHTGTLWQPRDGCVDMTGTIAFFVSLDPDVRLIRTYAGKLPDVAYERDDNGQWYADQRAMLAAYKRHRYDLDGYPRPGTRPRATR